MNTRSTLVLALLSLGVLVYLAFMGWENPGTKDKELAQQRLINLSPEEVDRIELTNPQGNFSFTKSVNGKWVVLTPVPHPADPNELSALLAEIEYSKRQASIPAKELPEWNKALETFGLSPIKTQLTVYKKNKAVQLIFGNPTSREGLVYGLLIDGPKQDVVIVEKTLETKLLKGLDQWRSKKIFEFLTADVTGLTLRKEGAEIEVEKNKVTGVWIINKPLTTQVDETEVASLLANLAGAQVMGFVADNAADIATYGFSSPSLALEIKTGQTAETIRVGVEIPQEKGVYYAQLGIRPTVFKISQDLHQTISHIFEQIRDRRIVNPESVAKTVKIRIEHLDSHLEFNLVNQEWFLASPKVRLADQTKVQAILKALTSVRATVFIPKIEPERKKLGLVKPALKIILTTENEKKEMQENSLSFSTPKNGEVFVDSPMRASFVSIPEVHLPSLLGAAHEWFGDKLQIATEPSLTSVKWERANQTYMIKKDQEWPVLSENQKIDQEIFMKQRERLASLPVTDWSAYNEKSFGTLFLRLTVTSAEVTTILEIGKDIGNGVRIARLVGENTTFTLNQEDWLLLSVIPIMSTDQMPPAP